jgi:hypothetical protein
MAANTKCKAYIRALEEFGHAEECLSSLARSEGVALPKMAVRDAMETRKGNGLTHLVDEKQ